jgi:hypothetical protein
LVRAAKGKSHPNLVTWFTFTLLNGINAAAAWSVGANQTAIFLSAATLATLSITLISLKFGFKRYTKFDMTCQAVAIIGLVLWLLTSNPSVTVAINITLDFIGLLPTLRHAWSNPYKETWQTFVIAMVAGVLTLISIQTYTFISLGAPIYILLADTFTASIIISRRSLTKA